MHHLLLSFVAILAIASCSPQAPSSPDKASAPTSAVVSTPPPAKALLQPAGPVEDVPLDRSDSAQIAASVVQLTSLTPQGDTTIKLFGTAGGDPAINGLYTYIAFFESPADGWRVFRLGDFLDYRVLAEDANRVDLEVRESVMDEKTGMIGERTRRMIISLWRREPGAPLMASVRPAA